MSQDQSKKSLEVLNSNLLKLYENLAVERQVMAKQGEILDKMIAQLKSEASVASELKGQIRSEVVKAMQETTNSLGEKIKEEGGKIITDDVKSTIQRLNQATDDSFKELQAYRSIFNRDLAVVLIMFAAAVSVSVLMSKVIIGRPIVRFNSNQAKTYYMGKKLETVWNDLSEKERNKIDNIYEHKTDDFN